MDIDIIEKLDGNNSISLNDMLKSIKLKEECTFSEALLIFVDFIKKNSVIDYQVNSLLDDFSGKIKLLNKYKDYLHDSLFMLLYLSLMMYNDLSNTNIKNKIKLNEFIKLTTGINNNSNFPIEFIKEIYNDIYDKIKDDNIIDNILHDKTIISDKKKCIIL
jgi:Sec7-like guanine-nucleotide exchange factor